MSYWSKGSGIYWGAGPQAIQAATLSFPNSAPANNIANVIVAPGTTTDLTNTKAIVDYVAASAPHILTTKGDILTRNALVTTRLPIGLDGQVFMADSLQVTGNKWAAIPPFANVCDTATAAGDLIVATGAHTYGRLGIGNARDHLTVTAGTAAWSANNSASVLSAAGDLLSTSAAYTLSRVAIGANGTVLSSNGVLPSWQALPANPVDILTTDGDILTRAFGAYARLAIATGSPGYQLTINPAGSVPVWQPSASVLTAIGDLVSVSATGPPITYSRIPASTAGRVLTANGVNVLPTYQVLPADVLDKATNVGDLIYCTSVGPVTYARLASGTINHVLTSAGANAAPAWGPVPASSIPNVRMLQAEDWDVPSNADWPISNIAGAEPDPAYNALNMRRFVYAAGAYGTGAGFKITVPSSSTSLTLKFWGRSTTAPGGVRNVSFRFYVRRIPDDAVGMIAWAYNSLSDLALINSSYFQANSQTRTLAQLGVTAGQAYHVEISRQAAGADNLVYDYLLGMLTLTWT